MSVEINEDVSKAWAADHPDVPIKLVQYDVTRLNAMLAAGTPPDLVRGLGAQETAYWAARNIAMPLDDYISASSLLTASTLNSVNDVWKFDGTKQGSGPTYGLTKDYSLDMMHWYNLELLNAAGVRVPDDDNPYTYDEALDVARELTKVKGGKVLTYGLWSTAPDVVYIQGMLGTAGATLLSDDLKTVDFSSPEAQRAIKWIADVAAAKVGYSVLDPNPDGWSGLTFLAQREAMAQGGYWFGGQVATGKDAGDWGRLAPAPLLGDTRFSPTTSATGHWIPTKAANPDAAFAFLEWFTAGPPAEERAASGWGLPVVTALDSKLPKTEEYQKLALATQKNENEYAGVLTFSPYATVTALTAVVTDLLPKLVSGAVTLGGFADEANDSCNELLAEGVSRVGG
jgi:multiple sugar transport system substrate-binding protein